jgi:hypothetical protein
MKRKFLSQKEINVVRHETDVRNSQQNRDGEKTTWNVTEVCGCGAKECFLHHRINR